MTRIIACGTELSGTKVSRHRIASSAPASRPPAVGSWRAKPEANTEIGPLLSPPTTAAHDTHAQNVVRAGQGRRAPGRQRAQRLEVRPRRSDSRRRRDW